MDQNPGLWASVTRLASTVLGMAQVRLELLANEWEEERLRLTKMLFYSLLAGFFFCLGVVLLTLLIIAMYWDTNRLLTIGIVAVAYLSVAAGLAISVMRQFRQKPKLFSASLGELTKDRALLEETK